MVCATKVGCLLVCLALTEAARAQTSTDLPKPLPPEVRATWEKAGAVAGWMIQDTTGVSFRAGADPGKAGEVPAFRFEYWPRDKWAKLPAPEQRSDFILAPAKIS